MTFAQLFFYCLAGPTKSILLPPLPKCFRFGIVAGLRCTHFSVCWMSCRCCNIKFRVDFLSTSGVWSYAPVLSFEEASCLCLTPATPATPATIQQTEKSVLLKPATIPKRKHFGNGGSRIDFVDPAKQWKNNSRMKCILEAVLAFFLVFTSNVSTNCRNIATPN